MVGTQAATQGSSKPCSPSFNIRPSIDHSAKPTDMEITIHQPPPGPRLEARARATVKSTSNMVETGREIRSWTQTRKT